MRRHLYLQIYVAFLCIAVLCFGVAVIAARVSSNAGPEAYRVAIAEVLADSLPKESSPALQARLERLAQQIQLDLVLRRADGSVLATTNPALSPQQRDHVSWGERHGPYAMPLTLPDGRSLMAVPRDEGHFGHSVRFFGFLFALLCVAAIGCWPIAKRITRRLERLQHAVDRVGAGDLSARVHVHGRDEVARLALSFNRALARIEALMNAQRRVLASASHELRSPMTRLRMALELLAEDHPSDNDAAHKASVAARTKLLEDSARDIEELDALVEDVLLSARLEAGAPSRPFQEVDMAQLVRAAAERFGAAVSIDDAPSYTTHGDERLLSRLLRNLLENAARYGAGTPIEASVQCEAGHVVVRVCDGGPGVAQSEREKIFEPFYRPEGHREGADGGVGLGLALVRQIATHHRGNVRYVQRARGSCFELRLPLAHASA